jgi:hypothetical protein
MLLIIGMNLVCADVNLFISKESILDFTHCTGRVLHDGMDATKKNSKLRCKCNKLLYFSFKNKFFYKNYLQKKTFNACASNEYHSYTDLSEIIFISAVSEHTVYCKVINILWYKGILLLLWYCNGSWFFFIFSFISLYCIVIKNQQTNPCIRS